MMLDVRLAKETDIQNILDLITESGYQYNNSYFSWINKHLYPNTKFFLAFEAGRIVGCYGLNIQKFQSNNVTLTGALGTQAVVHPSYRNLQIIVELLQYVENWAEENLIDFIYAFPNKKMLPVKVRMLGWEVLYDVCEALYEKKYIDHHVNLDECHDVVRVKCSSEIKDRLAGLSRQCNAENSLPYFQMVTDNEWFIQRYLNHPKEYYKIYFTYKNNESSLCVLKHYSDGNKTKLHLVDQLISNDSNSNFEGILSRIGSVLDKNFFDYLSVWKPFHDPVDKALEYNRHTFLCKFLNHQAKKYLMDQYVMAFMGMYDVY